jgi:transposase
VRALITARAQLVAQRVDLGNQILLKPFGLLAGKGGGKTFAEKAWSPAA